jgi:hypothetical protein
MWLTTALALAQAPAPTPHPCATAEHRAFDFWQGRWEVRQKGEVAGHNHIEPVEGGCGLREVYTGAKGGYSGQSLSFYDAATERWRQTWVDRTGQVLLLEGGPTPSGAMQLEGTRPGAAGPTTHRITFTPSDDGTVRQHWQVRPASGEWRTVFDGTYHRVTEAPSP